MSGDKPSVPFAPYISAWHKACVKLTQLKQSKMLGTAHHIEEIIERVTPTIKAMSNMPLSDAPEYIAKLAIEDHGNIKTNGENEIVYALFATELNMKEQVDVLKYKLAQQQNENHRA